MRKVWFIADDFGIAPGVDDAILDLLATGRLSGAGCMTVFPGWADRLGQLGAEKNRLGLHLTLTDQPALAGPSKLTPSGKLPGLKQLFRHAVLGQGSDEAIHRELDAQLAAFEDTLGTAPAYVDGHQHVHFLPPVRRWLRARADRWQGALPWLRGAPAASGTVKSRIVGAMAVRFTSSMRKLGYTVRGPLSGFYDWSGREDFRAATERMLPHLREGSVFMCHPGRPDQTLSDRDPFVEARLGEYDFLRSDRFPALLASQGIEVARP